MLEIITELKTSDCWVGIQEIITDKLGMFIRIFDHNGILLYSSGTIPAFCHRAKQTDNNICQLCFQGVFTQVVVDPDQEVNNYRCQNGLSCIIAFAKMDNKNHLFIVVGGGYLLTGNESAQDKLTSWSAVIFDELRVDNSSVHVLSEADISLIKILLKLFVRYIKNMKKIARHQDQDSQLTIFLDEIFKQKSPLTQQAIYGAVAESIVTLPGLDAGAVIGLVDIMDNSIDLVYITEKFPDQVTDTSWLQGIGRWVILEGRCLVINDLFTDPRLPVDTTRELVGYIGKVVCYPMAVSGRIHALIFAAGRMSGNLEPEIISSIDRISRTASILIETDKSKKHLTEQIRKLTAVYEVARIVNSSLDLKAVLNLTVDLTASLFDVSVVYLCLYNDDYEGGKLIISRGLTPDEVASISQSENETDVLHKITEYPLINKGWTIGVLGIGFDMTQLNDQDLEVVKSFCNLVAIAIENNYLYDRLQRAHCGTVQALMRMIELKDPYISGHSERVGNYAALLARQMGMDLLKVEEIKLAGYLHEIGKVLVPQDILNKVDKLSNKDFDEIQKHPVIGAAIIDSIPELKKLAPAVKYHHERLDGSGYPESLRGEDIPVEAQVLAVVDTYEALISQRVYRDALSPNEALEILRKEAGVRLNPAIVKVFCDVVRKDFYLLYGNKQAEDQVDMTKTTEMPLLTERENEILELIVKGLSNKEIATTLYISEKTVKVHITNLLRKMNVSDRTKAAVLALQKGMIRTTEAGIVSVS